MFRVLGIYNFGQAIISWTSIFFSFFSSGKILEGNCADAAAKMTFTYNNLMKKNKKTLSQRREDGRLKVI